MYLSSCLFEKYYTNIVGKYQLVFHYISINIAPVVMKRPVNPYIIRPGAQYKTDGIQTPKSFVVAFNRREYNFRKRILQRYRGM